MKDILATLISVLLVGICVTIHYEVLSALSRRVYLPGRHRWLILASVFGALAAHVLEIWIFGAGYWVSVEVLELGRILKSHEPFDYVYYSAMVYTTVGFGDLIPEGPTRMITSTEALMGLSLITWSASFTYLQMQRVWRD
jgi:hypothetical protein